MKQQLRTSLSSILCFLLIAGVAAGSNGSVLCIGADDHVEVESVCQPCCASAERDCDASGCDLEHDDHEECSDCTDVAISLQILRERITVLGSGLQSHFSSLQTLSAVSGTQYLTTAVTSRAASGGLHDLVSASFSRHLASTVIRC